MEVKALRLGARRRSSGLYVCGVTGGANPCARGGVAYIECAKTLAILHYKGFNVHKDRALLITPPISVINDLKDYGVNI